MSCAARYGLIWIAFLWSGFLYAASPMTVLTYNVENFFHPSQDSLTRDDDFTPDGAYRWGYRRYYHKIGRIAQVVVSATDSWEIPAFVALQEVENDTCLRDLLRSGLRRCPYRYVHFDGPDARGIEVALLYDSTRVRVLAAQPIPVEVQGARVRDLLWVSALWEDTWPVELLVCHLPSQLGERSALRRKEAKRVIRAWSDSLLLAHPQAAVVVMGDMNSEPLDDLLPLRNMMLTLSPDERGTEKYQGRWNCLDQFYLSPVLFPRASVRVVDASFLLEPDERYIGLRPKRTFRGRQYNPQGYSDHLPVLLTIEWK